MLKTYSITITGYVQGIFFRAHTKDLADRIGVTGYVKNEEDGSVSITAQGEEEVLKDFIDWCHQGPELAQVDEVQVKEISNDEMYQEFRVE